MPGSINSFVSSFKNDVARAKNFDVYIPVPLNLIQYRKMPEQLSLRCEVSGLPGRTFSTFNQQIYGPSEKFPYQSVYGDLTLTFIVSDDMSEKLFFDAWMEFINPASNYNFKYKGDYTTQVTINQYANTGEKTYSVNLENAYPIDVVQMDLDWSAEGYHKMNVLFTYSFWRNNSLENIFSGAIDSAITNGIKAAAAAAGSPNSPNSISGSLGGLKNLGGNLFS